MKLIAAAWTDLGSCRLENCYLQKHPWEAAALEKTFVKVFNILCQ